MEWSTFWVIIAQVFIAWIVVMIIVGGTRNVLKDKQSKTGQTGEREPR